MDDLEQRVKELVDRYGDNKVWNTIWEIKANIERKKRIVSTAKTFFNDIINDIIVDVGSIDTITVTANCITIYEGTQEKLKLNF